MRAWLFFGIATVFSASAQELRQGRVFEPEQGAADLAERTKEYASQAEWEAKARKIRGGILKGAKLDPLPERTPLKPIRHSVKPLDGYSVENVAIESLPGLFVTGNLYLPEHRERMPLVLCPHGHWQGKDLAEHGRFRHDMQKRCGAMARMGCAVFAWDAVGFGESRELGWDHNFGDEVLRIQLWSAIRVLDFMEKLEGADPKRVGVTGASGGATLSMQLAAVDGRVTLSVPCAMVSSYFYGGCNCESGMPIHVRPGHVTNPVEIAAVIAPRPLLVISDGGDWSAHVPQDAVPHIRRIYGFYGKEDRVENAHFPDGKHDYNAEKRKPLYAFLAKHWKLDAARADEAKVEVLSPDRLRVFDAGHPVPAHALKANTPPSWGRADSGG
ncbi:acetylxylanesterase [Haloferula helveola]|uniref:Acetylxylanesterase n=1 Tax=Haloferula helveola TaxID=490095 RepID=A0ABN6H233_9BACT|nr:acetylxylanesterase [Haloferula helveola]